MKDTFLKRVLTFTALILCLSVCHRTVYGQGRCTMQNIAGSYAFASTGASAIVAGAASDNFHWNALYGPIASVGVFALAPNGTINGRYWMVAGAMNFGLTALEFHGTVRLSDNCSGTFEYDLQGAPIKERFTVLGNGREIRAVATQTPVSTGNWLTTAVRTGGACGQQNVHGEYLFECRSLLQLPVSPPNIFGAATHLRMSISRGGGYTAAGYGKIGADAIELPAFGRITVHEDCTAEGTLESPALPVVFHARGVFFDEGKRGYWLPLVSKLPDGATFPQPYEFCQITQAER
jgi:hypothetical protein